MAQCYPDRAERMNVSGTSTLRCSVTAKGTLESCEATSETPADMGFGQASVSCLARLFRVSPMDQDGVPVSGGTITLTLHWTVPKEE